MQKILFFPISDTHQIAKHPVTLGGSLRIWCDYMMDCLHHGLSELHKSKEIELETTRPYPQWYKGVDKSLLYGNGFTIYGLSDIPYVFTDEISIYDNIIYSLDLFERMMDNYYDQVIVSIHNNLFKSKSIENYVKGFINVKNVKFVCGNDDPYIDERITNKFMLFKREIEGDKLPNNVFPINFCIPKEKVLSKVPEKLVEKSEEVPNHAGEAGWKIKSESEYYKKYQDASYALTYKKGGWDSLRHYEIMMNGCFPYFLGLDKCPQYTLHFLPKVYITEVMQSGVVTINDLEYILEYTRSNLTTEVMARYVLNRTIK